MKHSIVVRLILCLMPLLPCATPLVQAADRSVSPEDFSRHGTRLAAIGPLRKHPTNGRYFTDGTENPDGSLRTVYLTGTHTWANLQDCALVVMPEKPISTDPPPVFDYNAYLDLLQTNNHNFIRLWRWELPKTIVGPGGNQNSGSLFYSQPHPWLRSGPGMANDGKPKFDLNRLDQAYFDRLRDRVIAARERGIYVGIMFFEGWWLDGSPASWQWHPFHGSNNINGINGDANGDGQGEETNTRQMSPAVAALQKTYVRKVIDTVNDLDNVLYEIVNETQVSGSIQWQYDLIAYVKSYQAGKPKQHPVGMTWSWEGKTNANNNVLWNSQADWISPGSWNPYASDPTAAPGGKVSILDTDHIGYDKYRDDPAYSRSWVWKSFVRGHNPILMEDLLSKSGWIANRAAMGHTRTYANRMNLAAMTPRNDLSTTSYCLANSEQEYLVYQPKTGEFSVNLTAGTYSSEWFNPTTGSIATTGSVKAVGGNQTFTPPFSGPAVLYIRQPKEAAGRSAAAAHGLAAKYPGDADIAKDPAVLFVDNFESGNMKKWDQKRGRVVMTEDKSNAGRWCVQMPMERGQNHGGDAIKWFMPGTDAVYARFYVKFSPDYQYNHHFVWLGANQRTNKWSAFGKAGLKPNGTYYSTGMEPWFAWGKNPPPGEVNLYTYYLDMEPDRKMDKYWGNGFFPPGPGKSKAASESRVIPKLNEWQCWEFMIQANTAPDKADGKQAMWVDGKLAGEFTGIRWRNDLDLKVNCFWLEHYGYDEGDPTKQYWKDSQSVWFDDVVVARRYIGPMKK